MGFVVLRTGLLEMASLIRVLEQSCKTVSHAGLLGSGCCTGRKQQVQRACSGGLLGVDEKQQVAGLKGVRKIGILMTKIKMIALLVVINTLQFSLYTSL